MWSVTITDADGHQVIITWNQQDRMATIVQEKDHVFSVIRLSAEVFASVRRVMEGWPV